MVLVTTHFIELGKLGRRLQTALMGHKSQIRNSESSTRIIGPAFNGEETRTHFNLPYG